MKTAEVAIEHILTGILTLCAFVLPLLSGKRIDQKVLESEALIGVLGAAYLFGVVFDRLADTILSPIEQHLRLSLANQCLIKRLENNEALYKGVDPFPQDALEFSLRGGGEGRREWLDSLRSRIRTSRGLAVFGAPAALGIALFVHYLPTQEKAPWIWSWWPFLVIGLNLVFVLLSLLTPWLFACKKNPWRGKLRTYRTDDLFNASTRRTRMDEAWWYMLVFSSFYVLMMVNSLAATAYTLSELWPQRVLIFICGAAVTALPLWVWHRITATYMSFVNRQMPELLRTETAVEPATKPAATPLDR
jgi:hypothetical protein